MTYGRPEPPGTASARWLRERLLGMGLGEDQVIGTAVRPPARLTQADLEPAHYLPDLAPLVRRVSRLMGGARGLSLFVTGARGEEPSRRHTALQLALGLAPMGREIVLVDADFLRPGLGGLIEDPLADGVTDMARFGRSSRSLLLKPVPEGPWLLPTGSFPEDDPVPLEPEALRSVVYRISQVCHLALYIGPLPIRSELHPLARICDHVVYATLDESPETSVACTEAVRAMQAEGAHLLGVVSYASGSTPTTEGREPEAVPEPQRFGPGFRYVPRAEPPIPAPREVERPAARGREAAPRLPAFLEPTAEPRVTPIAPGPPVRELPPAPEPATPAASSASPPAPPPSPVVEKRPAEPQAAPAGLEFPRLDLPTLRNEAGAHEHVETPPGPEPDAERRVIASRLTARAPEEEPRVARPEPGFTSSEYAFEEERGGHGSTLLVIAVIVVTLGFLVVLGPRLLERWRESRNPTTQQTGVPPGAGSTGTSEPNDEAAARKEPQTTATPDDHQASQAGGEMPPATTPGGSAPSTAPAMESPSTSAPSTSPAESSTSPPAGSSSPQVPSATPPAAAASQPPPATSSPAAGIAAEDYGVHLASYRKLDQAQVEIRSLAARGFAARAIRTDLGERGIWYRVVAGPYATRDEAEKARAELLKLPEYKYAQVRRVPRD